MPASKPKINGPIPGENYTSNTKNYPWHRPPEITDIDAGIEAAIKQLSTRKGAYGLLNNLQAGVTVVQAADMFITSGIGAGKWAVDLGILLAGPVARMMEIMAKDAGIEFAMGLDDDPLPTISYYKKKTDISKSTASAAGQTLKDSASTIETPTDTNLMDSPVTDDKGTGGFMSRGM